MTYVRSNPIQIFIYWGLVDTLRCNILYFFLFLTLRIIYNGNPFDPEKFLRCSVGICLPVFVNGSVTMYEFLWLSLYIWESIHFEIFKQMIGWKLPLIILISSGKYKKIPKLLRFFWDISCANQSNEAAPRRISLIWSE